MKTSVERDMAENTTGRPLGTPATAVRVALVEDDDDQRAFAQEEIEAHPEFVLTGVFTTGEDAVAGLAACRPDVALVDIELPGISGIEVVRACKDGLTGTQFMMLTVIEDVPKVVAALSAGATGYLLKKDLPTRLYESVLELHRGGSPMSSSIARQVVLRFQGGAEATQGNAAETSMERVAGLTGREREILELLAAGRLYKEIAAKLGIGQGTVNTHIRKIYEKLHAHNRWEAVRMARR